MISQIGTTTGGDGLRDASPKAIGGGLGGLGVAKSGGIRAMMSETTTGGVLRYDVKATR